MVHFMGGPTRQQYFRHPVDRATALHGRRTSLVPRYCRESDHLVSHGRSGLKWKCIDKHDYLARDR